MIGIQCCQPFLWECLENERNNQYIGKVPQKFEKCLFRMKFMDENHNFCEGTRQQNFTKPNLGWQCNRQIELETLMKWYYKFSGKMYENVFTQSGCDFDEHTCSGIIHTMIISVPNPYTIVESRTLKWVIGRMMKRFLDIPNSSVLEASSCSSHIF